jgi:hypothetical protein
MPIAKTCHCCRDGLVEIAVQCHELGQVLRICLSNPSSVGKDHP